MIVRLLITALLLGVMLLCSGCYGARETEDIAYVLVIGIDKAADGQQKFTYQIARPRGAGGGGGGGGEGGEKGEGGAWVINTFTAPTPSETRMLLKSTMSRFPNIGHVCAFIIGEDAAREGLGDLMSYFMRNRDFRGTMIMVVTEGTAEEYIKRNNPKLETSVAKYYETLLANMESGYYLRTDLHDFYLGLKAEGVSPYAAYSATNPMSGADRPAAPPAPEEAGKPYIAGDVPRTGEGDPTEFAGLALFRGDRMVGILDSDETRAVSILRSKGVRGYVGIVDPLKPEKNINIAFRLGAKPKIKAALYDGTPLYKVSVFIEAEIMGIPSGINYELGENRVLLENQISQLFAGHISRMLRHTQMLGSDPVGFGLHLRPQFPDYNALKQADFTALYQAAEIQVNVTTKIRRTGLDWQTSPWQTHNAEDPPHD